MNEEQSESIQIRAPSEKPVRVRPAIILGTACLVSVIATVAVVKGLNSGGVDGSKASEEVVLFSSTPDNNNFLKSMPDDYDQLKIPPEEELVDPLPPPPAISPISPVAEDKPNVDEMEDDVWKAGMFLGKKNNTYAHLGNTSTSSLSDGGKAGQLFDGSGSPDSYAEDLPPDDKQNLQNEKLAFLNQANNKQDYILDDRLHAPISPYEIKAGTFIPAALITAINSDLPGDVVAQVTEHVYDSIGGNHLLIPQGSRLLGRYDSVISYGQERLLVAWQRLVLPNGKSIQLDGMIATDPTGASGLEDEVDNHFLRLAGGVLLSSTLALGGNLANDNEGSLGDDVGDTVAQEASRVGQRFTSKSLNIQPTLKIRGGAEVRVFVNKDMVLEPYRAL